MPAHELTGAHFKTLSRLLAFFLAVADILASHFTSAAWQLAAFATVERSSNYFRASQYYYFHINIDAIHILGMRLY